MEGKDRINKDEEGEKKNSPLSHLSPYSVFSLGMSAAEMTYLSIPSLHNSL